MKIREVVEQLKDNRVMNLVTHPLWGDIPKIERKLAWPLQQTLGFTASLLSYALAFFDEK
ncbi:hypothetical protein M378DRAFT_164114 [Amanita muscaria Koide BX008]|uniref:Uncharacterized protein n=1 Tax=Amanita muscaria (strain Koide BX008) TaxID=946122 RepID=A0A0C2TAG3_AMAMK|nr:hypothetical protein M378DRAFT_164114 [Amanita muscaria Koide BX008]